MAYQCKETINTSGELSRSRRCYGYRGNFSQLIGQLRLKVLKRKFYNTRKKSVSDRSNELCKSNATLSGKLVTPSLITEDDLEIVELIGYGDLGKVYLTKDKNNGKLYATKVISKRKAASRDKISRILTEQKILLTLNHPFLAKLCHSFQTTDNVYFVMEYCPGGELFRRLQSLPSKSISEEYARFYAAEVLCALEYLHLMGFIYRDLKPENILLSEDGHIVLSDFDLSRCADSKYLSDSLPPKMVKKQFINLLYPSSSSNLLQIDTRSCTDNISASSFVGTEEYLSPEVIAQKTHTSAVDWWALGIFIYELVHGYSPFKGQTKHSTFDNIIKMEVTFYVPLSSKCKRMVKSLLQKDPKKRLGSSTGASEIKAHPFFDGIIWDLLRNCKPPQIWDIRPVQIKSNSIKNTVLAKDCYQTDTIKEVENQVKESLRSNSAPQSKQVNPSPPLSASSTPKKNMHLLNPSNNSLEMFSDIISTSLV